MVIELELLVAITALLALLTILTYDLRSLKKCDERPTLASINELLRQNTFNIPNEDMRIKEAKLYRLGDKYIIITLVLSRGSKEVSDEDLILPDVPQVLIPLATSVGAYIDKDEGE